MNRLYKRSEVDMISCHMLTHVCLGDEVDDSCYPRYDFFCLKNCIRIVYVGLTEMIPCVSDEGGYAVVSGDISRC